ncbi:GH1 family beta-glucosidase [Limimaricola sp.]|uniref:GH1 family beta-glucosidase n=1 Tax=Limimaricola sp. TaxID=2211665 RepID=UPI004058DDD7
MSFSFTRSDFPADFLFGAATAAYQIEGHAFGGAGASHWDSYAATPGNVTNADDGAVACDHYHRFEQDLDLVQQGGFDVYRFSVSWARIMPDGRHVNPEGLAFYDRLVDAIVARGLKPYLTLYHWDLPSALADTGGWTNPETADLFAAYTRAVIERIGDRVEAVATINEPWCVAWLSHFIGAQAPGLRDIRAATRAMHHVMLAHGKSLAVMREMGQQNLGIVLNLADPHPASGSTADIAATRRMDGISNRWFLDALFKGAYPEDILDALRPHMPAGLEDEMALISAPIDWLGINYYTRGIVADAPGTPWPQFDGVEGPLPKTDMGWEIYPEGLGTLLARVARDYTGDLPLYVTENGMAGDDHLVDGVCDDPVRLKYFDDHLQVVRGLIAEGVPVKGYFAWSLLDNYEWSFGYEKRFGLVHVDYETQTRTPKRSFEAFRAALNAAPRRLAASG